MLSDPTPAPMIPHDFPPAREMAEAMAREWTGVFARHHFGDDDLDLAWSQMDDDVQEASIRAMLDLICDPTRPASRDSWARYLAERLGFTNIDGVVWRRSWRGFWELHVFRRGCLPIEVLFGERFGNHDGDPLEGWTRTAPVEGLTDPATALALAVTTVGGSR